MPSFDNIDDVDEIKRRLREMGVPIGEFTESGGKTVTSPFLDRQRGMLEKALVLLEQQLENDIKLVGELHEKVQRLEHGGGS